MAYRHRNKKLKHESLEHIRTCTRQVEPGPMTCRVSC